MQHIHNSDTDNLDFHKETNEFIEGRERVVKQHCENILTKSQWDLGMKKVLKYLRFIGRHF